MPGIDYQKLRAMIPIEQVLDLLRFQPTCRRGDAHRGWCPIHDPNREHDRTCFSVNLERNIFQCFRCGIQGNQLDLWHLHSKQPFHPACIDLCQQLEFEPPWLDPPPHRESSKPRNPTEQLPRQATTSPVPKPPTDRYRF